MHPQVAQLYPRYLFNLHCMMRAAVPLMEAAIKSAQDLHATDPVATQMIPYLQKHIPEETHSHWPLEDLEALGFDSEELLKRTPAPAVAALVGAQYYWIFHYHPIALLGYLEFAEGYPPDPDQVEALMRRTGYPREAFRNLRRHARLDLKHREELHELLDSLPLTPQHAKIISLSALESARLSILALEEIIEQYEGD